MHHFQSAHLGRRPRQFVRPGIHGSGRLASMLATAGACLGLLGGSACQALESGTDVGIAASNGAAATLAPTRLALTVDYLGDTDVSGFRMVVSQLSDDPACTPLATPVGPLTTEPVIGTPISVDVELEDMVLTGPTFGSVNPFDTASGHIFADHFFTLPAGCFHVDVQPLAGTDPSASCAPAYAGALVSDGATTEVTLISQCVGPEVGALDALAALNHPPTLELLEVNKFAFECEATTLCATVSDPDGDPLEYTWTTTQGTITPDAQVSPDCPAGSTASATIVADAGTGNPTVTVRAYDLLSGGQRIEDWLNANYAGPSAQASHDDLELPMYVTAQTRCLPEGTAPGGDPTQLPIFDRGAFAPGCQPQAPTDDVGPFGPCIIPPTVQRILFVSENAYSTGTSPFTSPADGHAICNDDAQTYALPGTYAAIIADTQNPNTEANINPGGGPVEFVDVLGTPLGITVADLFGGLSAPGTAPVRFSNGSANGGNIIWTGLEFDGSTFVPATPGPTSGHCSDWSHSSFGPRANNGRVTSGGSFEISLHEFGSGSNFCGVGTGWLLCAQVAP